MRNKFCDIVNACRKWIHNRNKSPETMSVEPKVAKGTAPYRTPFIPTTSPTLWPDSSLTEANHTCVYLVGTNLVEVDFRNLRAIFRTPEEASAADMDDTDDENFVTIRLSLDR